MGLVMDYVVYVVLLFAATSPSFTHCSRLVVDRSLSRAAASAPPQIFSVLSYGAVGDGAADDTRPFRSAWEAACQADHPAVLLIPHHYTITIQSTFLRGPCRNRLTFQIEGNLTPLDGPGSWPEKYSKQMWMVFYRMKGMTMQGGGIIDGRGQKWWDLPCKPRKGVNRTTDDDDDDPCDSPTAIRFIKCSNLVVQGFKMRNSPKFHFRFDKCQHVRVDSMRIYSPAGSPNTDGIHLGDSTNISIYNSVIATGDDCVSIGAGTFNVDIRNVSCDHTHGISIGSLGWNETRPARVSNITVRDCVIKRSDSGVRIKTWQGGHGVVSNVSFTNIVMDNVRNPIIIDQFYCIHRPGGGWPTCSNRTSALRITDISYTNIKGTYDATAPPVRLACSDAVPCTNLKVSDVELLPAPAHGRPMMVDPFCWNAYGDIAGAATVPPLMCLNRPPPTPSVIASDGSVDRYTVVCRLLRLTATLSPLASPLAGFWIVTYLCIIYILALHLRFVDGMGVLLVVLRRRLVEKV